MVIVEPYRWIKSTAIKERLDLANKLNEIISVLNQYPVNIEDIDMTVSADGVFTFIFTLSDGTTKEMSFSMGDYIDNTVASAINSALTSYATISYVDTKDSENVKKTGVNVVTGDIQVPTPSESISVANKQYVDNKRIIKYLNNSNWFSTLVHDTFKEGDEFDVAEMTLANCTIIALSKYYDENTLQKRFNAVGFLVISNVYYPLRLITIEKSGGVIAGYINNGELTNFTADLRTSTVYGASIVHYN